MASAKKSARTSNRAADTQRNFTGQVKAAGDALFADLVKGGAKALERQPERSKLAIPNLGEYFVGRLVGISESTQTNSKGGTFPIYYFEGPDGEACFWNGNHDTREQINDAHIGNVLAVRNSGEKSWEGAQYPMKLYQIVDCGSVFPLGAGLSHAIVQHAAAPTGDDLPF